MSAWYASCNYRCCMAPYCGREAAETIGPTGYDLGRPERRWLRHAPAAHPNYVGPVTVTMAHLGRQPQALADTTGFQRTIPPRAEIV
jgi:hypothetical protein